MDAEYFDTQWLQNIDTHAEARRYMNEVTSASSSLLRF
jgi:hypothetical protein